MGGVFHNDVSKEEGDPAGDDPACGEVWSVGNGHDEIFGGVVRGFGVAHEAGAFGLAGEVGEDHSSGPSDECSGEF